MQCYELQGILEEFLEGGLDSKTEGLIKAHLNECANCRKELLIAEKISVAIKNLPEPRIPEGLYDSIAVRYDRYEIQTAGIRDLVKSFFRGLKFVENRGSYAILSSAMAIAVAAFLILYKLSPTPVSVSVQPHFHSNLQAESAKSKASYSLKEIEEAKEGLVLALGQVQKAFEVSSNVVSNEFDKFDKWISPLRAKQEGN